MVMRIYNRLTQKTWRHFREKILLVIRKIEPVTRSQKHSFQPLGHLFRKTGIYLYVINIYWFQLQILNKKNTYLIVIWYDLRVTIVVSHRTC